MHIHDEAADPLPAQQEQKFVHWRVQISHFICKPRRVHGIGIRLRASLQCATTSRALRCLHLWRHDDENVKTTTTSHVLQYEMPQAFNQINCYWHFLLQLVCIPHTVCCNGLRFPSKYASCVEVSPLVEMSAATLVDGSNNTSSPQKARMFVRYSCSIR